MSLAVSLKTGPVGLFFLLSLAMSMSGCSHPSFRVIPMEGRAVLQDRSPSSLSRTGSTVASSGNDLKITVDCQARCQKGDSARGDLRSIFSPAENGLTTGNGDLIGGLTLTLQTWSEDRCFQFAVKTCGWVNEVSDFQVLGMSSGAWKMEGSLGCDVKDIVVSPYDSRQSPIRVDSSGLGHSSLNDARRFWNESSLGRNENCRVLMKSSTCFGDCMVESSGQWVQSLATPSPGDSMTTEVCADPLIEVLRQKKWNRAEAIHQCNLFYWAAVTDRSRYFFGSCAAFRGRPDCAAIVDESL